MRAARLPGLLGAALLALCARIPQAAAEDPDRDMLRPEPRKADQRTPPELEQREDELVERILTSDPTADDLAWLYSQADEYAPSGLTGEPVVIEGLPERQGAPREWDPRWRKFGAGNYVLTGAGFVASGMSNLIPPVPSRWRRTNSLDEWGRRNLGAPRYEAGRWAQDASDIFLSLNVAFPLLIDALIIAYWHRRSSEVAAQIALISLEAAAVSTLFQGTVSALASRQRPYGRDCGTHIPENLEDCSGSSRYRSYFSGHTSLAFAAALVTCSHHARHELFGDELADGLACGGSVASAATVGLMRIVGNKHYVTDVATGAAIGALSGLGVPWLLHYGFPAEGDTGVRLRLLPTAEGLIVNGSF